MYSNLQYYGTATKCMDNWEIARLEDIIQVMKI
jgi:hypothetical protein